MTTVGNLVVKPLSAKLKRDTETFGKMDPYCVIKMGSNTAKTKVHTDAGKFPAWNDKLTMVRTNESLLTIEVWDKDQMKSDDLIAETTITLEEIIQKKSVSKWYTLDYKGKVAGEILVEFNWIPDTSSTKTTISTNSLGMNPTLGMMQGSIYNSAYTMAPTFGMGMGMSTIPMQQFPTQQQQYPTQQQQYVQSTFQQPIYQQQIYQQTQQPIYQQQQQPIYQQTTIQQQPTYEQQPIYQQQQQTTYQQPTYQQQQPIYQQQQQPIYQQTTIQQQPIYQQQQQTTYQQPTYQQTTSFPTQLGGLATQLTTQIQSQPNYSTQTQFTQSGGYNVQGGGYKGGY